MTAVKQNEGTLFQPLMHQYEVLGRDAIGQPVDVGIDENDYDAVKARIGLKVAQALIWLEAKRPDYYGLDLYDAEKAARNWGHLSISAAILNEMRLVGVEPLKPTLINRKNQPEFPDESTEKQLGELSLKFEVAKRPVKKEMHRNTLYVNDEVLVPTDGEALLWQALTEGKAEIRRGLEAFKLHMQKLIPGAEVSLAPFEVMHFGKKKPEILTKFGLELKEDVIYNHKGLKDEFQPLWRVILASGYVPEVRIQNFKYSGTRIGLWARLPEVVERPKSTGNT